MPGGWLSPDEGRRLGRSLRAFERESRNSLPPLEKKIRSVGESCTNKLSILVMGAPTGGTLVIPMTVDGTTENISITIPATTTALKTAFEGHSKVDAGQMPFTSASGGTTGLPSYEVYCTPANGLSADDITLGTIDDSGMTGGFLAYSVVRKCCG